MSKQIAKDRPFIFSFNRENEIERFVVEALESKGRGGMKAYITELILQDIQLSPESIVQRINARYPDGSVKVLLNTAENLGEILGDVQAVVDWFKTQAPHTTNYPYIIKDAGGMRTIDTITLINQYGG